MIERHQMNRMIYILLIAFFSIKTLDGAATETHQKKDFKTTTLDSMEIILEFHSNCLPHREFGELYMKIYTFIQEEEIDNTQNPTRLLERLDMGPSFVPKELSNMILLHRQPQIIISPENKESIVFFINAVKIIKNNFSILQQNITHAPFLTLAEKASLNNHIAEIIGLADTILYKAELARRIAKIKLSNQ